MNIQIGSYYIYPFPWGDELNKDYLLTLDLVDSGKWKLMHWSYCFNKRTKEFDYEPSPSNREDSYLTDHRFDDVDEAFVAAREILSTLKVDGLTYEEKNARREARLELKEVQNNA